MRDKAYWYRVGSIPTMPSWVATYRCDRMISQEKKKVILMAVVVVIGVITISYILPGLGSSRAQSSYTGHVVDVVEDKGIVYRPTWVNMKTDPRSSDVQEFCILQEDEDELLPKFYDAMETGDRYTITYSRPLYVTPLDCPTDTAIVQDIRKVNSSTDG